MAGQHEIRLGAVKYIYTVGEGLRMRSAHPPDIELTLCQADLPDLIAFLDQHMPSAGDTVRLECRHATLPDQHTQAEEPGEGNRENAPPQRHP